MKFGDYLVERNLLDPQDLKHGLKIQKIFHRKIGRILKEMGWLLNTDLDRALTEYFREFGRQFPKSPDLRSYEGLDADEDGQLEILEGKDCTLVFGRAVNDDLLEKIEDQSEKKVLYVYDRGKSDSHEGPDIVNHVSLLNKAGPDENLRRGDPYSQFFRYCLELAKTQNASDLHFEPFHDRYLVRIRVHGELQIVKEIDRSFADPLTYRIKEIINMDIAQVIDPQDSQAQFQELAISIRGSSVPVSGGSEKIVLRLLYPEAPIGLSTLGLSKDQDRCLRNIIELENGLIIISGPTGSGKTTTLYSLLSEMDKVGKNISTLENPVEKSLSGINQLDVGDFSNFPKFQRALMRQDPDIVLLGEIRDKETADVGMKLASSGHLVISTIHANGAVEVIDRLYQLGVSKDNIQENLRASIAQRLVRLICSCSMPMDDKDISLLETRFGFGNYRAANSSGCEKCSSGLAGRKAIIEYVGPIALSNLKKRPEPVSKLSEQVIQLSKQGEIDATRILNLEE